MTKKLIGYVGVDSGQLLLCDPCYIDTQWNKEEFEDIRIYQHKKTKYKLQFRKDFNNFESIIVGHGDYNGYTMNKLIATDQWDLLPTQPPKENFSYNACCQKTLSKSGHGQLNYNKGHRGVGVAFSTAIGDGMYPVYAHYDKKGNLIRVAVEFYSKSPIGIND